MNTSTQRLLLATLATVACAGIVTACDRPPDAALQFDAGDTRVGQAGPRSEVGQTVGNAADSARDKVKDATITATVNAQLAADPKLSALRVDVDTVGGRVRLTGTAPDASSAEHAGRLASRVEGVTAVDNRLVVAARN